MMTQKLIVICNNQSVGESLAFSLTTLFGFESHILHRANRRLYAELNDLELFNSVVLLEDGMVGVNYPTLIHDIGKAKPQLMMLVGDSLSYSIPISTIRALGCDAVLGDEVGLKGIINIIQCKFAGESKLDSEKEPFKRLDESDREFLADEFHLKPGEVQKKYRITQQRESARRSKLFKKLHLNPGDLQSAFRALCHLYSI